ncbi:MAG: NCS2 family permease [Gammaproteobacteria bacterium]|jgi:AGZA family xanthine/uracil permease-like MFS transporter
MAVGFLPRRFALEAHGTDVRTELVAGATTFLTMAYIAFVNPAILQDAGMDFGAVFVATCLSAAFGTLVMGLYANYPIALAPGMGLNAFFTYGVVIGLDYSWQVALGAVFISGILFVILSVLPVREWLINAIPQTMKLAISAGIGLFLGIIALRNAGVIIPNPTTLVATGDLTAPQALLALLGFTAIIGLHARRVPGAVVVGILGITAIGIGLDVSPWKGFASLPPDPTPTLFALDIAGALEVGLISVILTFLVVDIFDTAGTLIGVAHQARLLDARGRLPRLKRALLADSTATVFGALAGSSPVTSYIESAAGTNAGGRTGMTAVVVAALFVLCLFLAPLAESVPSYATAPAILFVACLMARTLAEIDWRDATEFTPAVITAIGMPLTFSIADGIGLGFICYAGAKLAAGRFRECSPAVILIALVFVGKFALA